MKAQTYLERQKVIKHQRTVNQLIQCIMDDSPLEVN